MAKKDKEAAATAAPEAEVSVVKSIVNSKYRGKYAADQKDWLAKFIDTHATKTKSVKVKSADGEGTETKKVPDGVDVDALHSLAEANGLDIESLKAQSGNHGYAGRARMTVRNMLQTVAKQRHGLHGNDGQFHEADPAFLTAKSAPETPTHERDGTKKAKPSTPTPEGKAEAA